MSLSIMSLFQRREIPKDTDEAEQLQKADQAEQTLDYKLEFIRAQNELLRDPSAAGAGCKNVTEIVKQPGREN